ncbi:secreted trypsin-like serine protease [Vibrio vulnificus]|uniref:S1 family peptidase n=1 Tax=Vibrio vulnificus TaxID=672 RepID=UPI0009B637D8|nr:serine protease [Vibrio vulnificus]OQK59990.1 secreted trypsin-like serine protease [Vibrio vulnificus]OQK62841.1 secreted trypsin-like serine protease [Vibrio vulnificus]
MFSIHSHAKITLCVALLFSGFSFAANEVESRIVNGTVIDVNRYSSFASLFFDSLEYDGVYFPWASCGATILDTSHVLTAAHCVEDLGSMALFLVVVPQLQDENDYPFGNIQRHRVAKIFYPDNFSNSPYTLFPNDIAILKLENPMNIDSVNDVIRRPQNEVYRNASETFFAVGHGNTRSGFDSESQLQETPLTYISNTQCANVFSAGNYLSSKQICFDGNFSQSSQLKNSTCQGDSGGPVYWENNGVMMQVGVTSFGPNICGDPNWAVTSVFTEITDYASWIDSVLAGNETAKVTVTEQMRLDYMNGDTGSVDDTGSSGNNEEAPMSFGSSSGGGAVGLWLLMCYLLHACLTRVRESIFSLKRSKE